MKSKKVPIEKEVIKALSNAPLYYANLLASFNTGESFMLGVLCYDKENIEHCHSVSLNKELAEYLYNSLGKFLGKEV